jgi:hypothetical protein
VEKSEFVEALAHIINEEMHFVGVGEVQTFHQAGLLTRDEGLVVKLDDGTEFQVTVTRR